MHIFTPVVSIFVDNYTKIIDIQTHRGSELCLDYDVTLTAESR